jgi:hypothetical protein
MDFSDFSSAPWLLAVKREAELISKLDSQSSSLSELVRQIFQGLITGADSVYILEMAEENEDECRVYSNESDSELVIEPDLLKPLASGKEVERHGYPETGDYLIFPYKLDENGARLIDTDTFESQYPRTWEYLCSHESKLRARESGKMDKEGWYAYSRTQNLDKHEFPKLGSARLVDRLSFFGDYRGEFYLDNVDVNGVLLHKGTSLGYLLAVLNSKLLDWRFKLGSVPFRGGFYSGNKQFIADLPIRDIPFTTPPRAREQYVNDLVTAYERIRDGGDPEANAVLDAVDDDLGVFLERADVVHDFLAHLAREMTSLKEERHDLNVDVTDYLSEPDGGGIELTNLGDRFQPATGLQGSILADTAEDREKLQIDRLYVEVEDTGDANDVDLRAAVRYKPSEDEDISEDARDQNGYYYPDTLNVGTLTGCTDREAGLVAHWLRALNDRGDGFSGYRDNAAKTISLLDRLFAIRLPDLSAAPLLGSFLDTAREAETLDARIAFTDRLIDQIVYRLYGLTDEEVAVVES